MSDTVRVLTINAIIDVTRIECATRWSVGVTSRDDARYEIEFELLLRSGEGLALALSDVDGEHRGFSSMFHTHLHKEVRHVVAYRLFRQEHRLCDLAIRLSLGNEVEDPSFLRRQWLQQSFFAVSTESRACLGDQQRIEQRLTAGGATH